VRDAVELVTDTAELVRGAICSLLQEELVGDHWGTDGLCRELKTNAEAASLLKTLAEQYPLAENITNPWLVTDFDLAR
jgi:hypothetical protein